MTELTTRQQQLIELDIMKEIHRICEEHDITYYIMYGSLIGAIRHKGFIPWDDDIDIVMPYKDYKRFCRICMEGALTEGYLLQNHETDPYFEFHLSRVCKTGTFSDAKPRAKLKSWKYCYVDVFPLFNLPGDEEEQKKQEKAIIRAKKLIRYRVNYVYEHQSIIKKALKSIVRLPFKLVPLDHYVKKVEKAISMHDGEFSQYVGAVGNNYEYQKEKQLREDYDERILVPFEDTELWIPVGYDRILRNIYGDYMQLPPESERHVYHKAYLLNAPAT